MSIYDATYINLYAMNYMEGIGSHVLIEIGGLTLACDGGIYIYIANVIIYSFKLLNYAKGINLFMC